jgi:hypothetical protein
LRLILIGLNISSERANTNMLSFWIGAYLASYLNRIVRRKYDDSSDRVVIFVETDMTFWFPLAVKNVADALGPSWNIHIFTTASTQTWLTKQLAGIEYRFTEIGTVSPVSLPESLMDISFWNMFSEEHVLFARVNAVFAPETTLEKFLKYSFVPAAVTSNGKTCCFHGTPSLRRRSLAIKALESGSDSEPKDSNDVTFFLNTLDSDTLPDLQTCLDFSKICMYPTDVEAHSAVVVGHLQAALADRGGSLKQKLDPRRLEHAYDTVYCSIYEPRKHAMFFQSGNFQRLAEIVNLLGTVDRSLYDIYFSWHTSMDDSMKAFWTTQISQMENVMILSTDNRGADVGQFMLQLFEVNRKGIHYDHFMKVHTKSDHVWFRDLATFYIERLATNRSMLDSDASFNGIAPQKYLLGVKEHVSYSMNCDKLDEICKLSETDCPTKKSQFIGGTFVYARYSCLERIIDKASALYELLVPGYPGLDGKYEHACERLIGMSCEPYVQL